MPVQVQAVNDERPSSRLARQDYPLDDHPAAARADAARSRAGISLLRVYQAFNVAVPRSTGIDGIGNACNSGLRPQQLLATSSGREKCSCGRSHRGAHAARILPSTVVAVVGRKSPASTRKSVLKLARRRLIPRLALDQASSPPPTPPPAMFANHFVTIAPHAAVMVSPKDFGSRSPTTTAANANRSAKKLRRAKSERTNVTNDKKPLQPEIRIASRQSC